MNEFTLIDRYFRALDTGRSDVLVGIGDDAAILAPTTEAMAVCTDTLVADVHFLPDDDPFDIGFKSLAVNLSDLAAMGANPRWAMINLVMPAIDESWLEGFCRGFSELAGRHGVSLIGGDTTRGPLSISVQAGGTLNPERSLRRDAARVGQAVYLGGPVGDGYLGLQVARDAYRPDDEDRDYLLGRMRRPEPAVGQGAALSGIARAAIDVSDGLLADLGHVLDASGGLGAVITLDSRMFSPAAQRYLDTGGGASDLITGGDDYVLCFTVEPGDRAALEDACRRGDFEAVHIGVVTSGDGIEVRDRFGNSITTVSAGYRHFDNA